jgi:predicted lipoprotein with Yx(FWY)xxD motif
MNFKSLVLGIALSATATLAMAAGPVVSDTGLLVDANGMTLYIFDKDTAGVSTCYDGCADSWPAYIADAGASAAAAFTLVERNDGLAQWAVDGMPLYYWAGDQAPGDATGDGVGGVWHVVKP